MSARHLKRLQLAASSQQASKTAPEEDADEDADVEEDSDSDNVGTVRNSNPFAMLDNDDDDDDDDDDENIEGDEEEKKEAPKQPVARPSQAGGKKKQQKRAAGKKKPATSGRAGKKKATPHGDASLDALVQAIEQGLPVPAESKAKQTPAATTSRPLFALEARHLNAENELRRLFGSETIDEALNQRSRHPASGGRNVGSWRLTMFVRVPPQLPPPNYFASGRGVEMTLVSEPGEQPNVRRFRVRWAPEYLAVHEQFVRCVATLDPHSLLDLLAVEPYHLDALLQTSLLLTQTGQHEEATELIERGLVSFEACFHPAFQPLAGTCRISYADNPHAQPFFKVLFRYAQILARKGCCRTALEVTRLILQLDPTDPLFVRLMIDYFCVRSKQHRYLLRFYNEYTDAGLLLPNICYGVALAQFYANDVDKQPSASSSLSSSSSSSLSEQATPTRTSKSDALLQNALIAFPAMLPLIAQQSSFKSLQDVAVAAFFTSPAVSSPAIDRLLSLYIARNGPLWKDPRLEAWLRRNVDAVLARVADQDPAIADAQQRVRSSPELCAPDAVFATLAESDYTDNVAALPRDIMQQAAMAYQEPDVVHAPTTNPFWLFLHSLMPWNPNPTAPPPE